MAEGLTAVVFAANKLSTILSEESRILGGLRQEVQLISDEFGHMKAFLKKVTESSHGEEDDDDPQLKEWIRQVRDAAYDTEDILDEFMLLFPLNQSRWNIVKSAKNLPARHRLATKLQNIKARIRNISEARLRYDSHYGRLPIQVPSRLPVKNPWRQSKDDGALLEEDQLVGIEKQKQHLRSWALDGDSQIKVVAVLGMGGLGKTTLVKKVYEDAKIKSHFQIRVWITVSQNCDLQELLMGLIRQLQGNSRNPVLQSMDSASTNQLKTIIKEFLRRRRYLIVLDDVWEREIWNAFKYLLPENSYGGNCVMVTSRIADVASASCIDGSHGYVYRMECLNSQDSWTLFCRKTFKDGCCPNHLLTVAEGIVGKCKGLPLAIVAISGVLASKDLWRLDEWELVRRRLGDELEGAGNLDSAKKILRLSYDDLPDTLKTCLLYTSIYPEDYQIPCYHIIGLWIAERFVQPKSGQIAEEVAWDYLEELARRSIIQVSEVLYDGLPRFFYIHDLLREVLINKSREQNMISTISATGTIWPPEKVIRRLILNNNVFHKNCRDRQHDFNSVRSITTFGCTEPLSKALLSELLSNKFLKVLDFGCAHLEEIPKEIFNLIHLRYLGLSRTKVRTVPESIKRLQNLEYLDLRATNVRELPMEVRKLYKLHHLLVHQQVDFVDRDAGYYGFRAPFKIGELLELQTLDNIDAADSDKTRLFHEIGKLKQLRMLGITNLRTEDGRELCSSLEKLTNLRELAIASTIENKYVDVLDLNHSFSQSSLQSVCWLSLRGRVEKLPIWIKGLQRLGRINLILSDLTDDPLESLQQLPNLIEVTLIQAYLGESLSFRAGTFLKLKKLYLRSMLGLRWMKVEDGAMPCIEQLILEQLPSMKEIPFGVEYLRQLKKMELWAMSSELTKKLENEDFKRNEGYRKKIMHIPQVLIDGLQIDGTWEDQEQHQENTTQARHIMAEVCFAVRGSGSANYDFARKVANVVWAVAMASRHCSLCIKLTVMIFLIVMVYFVRRF